MRHRLTLVLLVAVALLGPLQQRESRRPARVGPGLLESWEPIEGAPAARVARGPCVFVIPFDTAGTLTFTTPENGVQFDIDGDGDHERVAWTAPGAEAAFLAVDSDGDGRVTSGRELVGERLAGNAKSAPDALLAFAAGGLPDQPRTFLDSLNSRFLQLLLWTDLNHNGISEGTELRSARHVLAAISLEFHPHHRRDRHGNESRHRGAVHRGAATGPNRPRTPEEDAARVRWMYDACLVIR